METQKISRRLYISNILISLLGFFNALYLFYSTTVGNIYCPLTGGIFKCEEVHADPHSMFLGVHVSLWGVIYFLILIILLFISSNSKNPYWLGFFLPAVSLFGFGFSIYLTCIEIFVITYFCEFCLFSALCSTVIFILTLITKKIEQGSIFKFLQFWRIFNKNEERTD